MKNNAMQPIISWAKRRGFVYPAADIYGGFGNFYSYGPYGVELKRNIEQLWWQTFVNQRSDIVGMEGSLITPADIWKSSGHLDNFDDLLIEDPIDKKRYRADHLIEEQHQTDVEGWNEEKITQFITTNPLLSPTNKKPLPPIIKRFNLMFSLDLNKTDGTPQTAFLRPETAQSIFVEWKNILDSNRLQLPFGIAQIGKAFRNEITPGNFIFRMLEFSQMEIEYFFSPPANFVTKKKELMELPHLDDWPADLRKQVNEIMDQWQKEMLHWCTTIGLPPNDCVVVEHPSAKLSHYSKRTFDIEFKFPFGQQELYGCAYRTDFDLANHHHSGRENLQYRDPHSGEVLLPHVIEPTFGLDRTMLALFCAAYHEEKLPDDKTRIVLKFDPLVAPVKVAILPLMKKNNLPAHAKKIMSTILSIGNIEYDDSGSIGKRYRRQDEIGTPFCVTIDHDTTEKNTVTIRHRDTMKQESINANDLLSWLQTHLN